MATWVVIHGPDGKRRVKPGEQFRLEPGERVVGMERDGQAETGDLISELAARLGIAAADLIGLGAKALGIEPCPTCQMRDKVLRRIREIGVGKAAWLLWRTIKGASLTSEEMENLDRELR